MAIVCLSTKNANNEFVWSLQNTIVGVIFINQCGLVLEADPKREVGGEWLPCLFDDKIFGIHPVNLQRF